MPRCCPIESASVDVVISNGVLNLVPEKDQAFSEIARILGLAAAFSPPISQLMWNCPRISVATSTSGLAESREHCRRKSL
jgi:hypothetical protein